MNPQAGPLHDRVQLSATELRVIAEFEERADETPHRRLALLLLVLGRALLWLAPPALALVILPAPLGWRVTGAVLLLGSMIAAATWLVSRVRARRSRTS